mmetsp:Transcript_75378/g.224721  ORF Transcript_75378/g.224721 Transcript_75378/m.224721 type:complete len:253 (-) Transcript_75378:53-811(-)
MDGGTLQGTDAVGARPGGGIRGRLRGRSRPGGAAGHREPPRPLRDAGLDHPGGEGVHRPAGVPAAPGHEGEGDRGHPRVCVLCRPGGGQLPRLPRADVPAGPDAPQHRHTPKFAIPREHGAGRAHGGQRHELAEPSARCPAAHRAAADAGPAAGDPAGVRAAHRRDPAAAAQRRAARARSFQDSRRALADVLQALCEDFGSHKPAHPWPRLRARGPPVLHCPGGRPCLGASQQIQPSEHRMQDLPHLRVYPN